MSNNSIFSNITNRTNGSSTPAPQVFASNLFVTILTYVDYVNRILSMLIFFTYLVLVIKLPFLRHKSLLYVHHSNLVGFMFCVMYIFYFSHTMPSTSSASLNLIFCIMSEVFWSISKYLRSYSILLIAIYRLMAVFFLDAFKFMNASYILLYIPIFVIWIFSFIVFVATKFPFQTTYGNLYCIDGLGPTVTYTVNYLIVTTIVSFL